MSLQLDTLLKPKANAISKKRPYSILTTFYQSRPPSYTSAMADTSPTYLSPKSPLSPIASSSSTTSSLPPWEWKNTIETSLADIVSSSNNIETPLEATTPSDLAPDRYLYYRLYTEDGAIPSRQPLYSSDLYLGCVQAALVPAPQRAADIKRYLCQIENLKSATATTSPSTTTGSLFISALDQTPIDDDAHVAILAFAGPGSMPDQPLALVIQLSAPEIAARWKMATGTGRLKALIKPSTQLEPRYLYYRLYAESAAVRCKSAKFAEPFIGRIDMDLIVPPHTVVSLKRCIHKAEGIGSFEFVQPSDLFVEVDSQSPMDENMHISTLTRDCPGFTSDKPMALVLSNSRVTSTDSNASEAAKNLGLFTIKLKAKHDCDYTWANSKFMDIKKDEFLYTNGRSHSEIFRGGGGGRITARNVKVFQVVNAAGSIGFVMKDAVKFVNN